MGLLDMFRRVIGSDTASRPSAMDSEAHWVDLSDPRLAAFMRDGETGAGVSVNADAALRNMAVFRCVDIIASTIGMLPLYLMRKGPDGQVEQAEDHPLYDLLLHRPNAWQTGHQFRSHMQTSALVDGNSYALIVRSTRRVAALVPLESRLVTVRQNADWTLTYRYNKPTGGWVEYPGDDILHVRGLSRDGILGLSRTKVAREAIGLALQAEQAAGRVFRNGMMVGGVLTHSGKLSDDAYNRLEASLSQRHDGVDNWFRNMILEEGMTYKERSASTVASTQNVETRNLQIEEVARAFGVPRPLLMQDSTSWGTGIEQLAILFVRFGLAPWFTAWEGEANVKLLTPVERRTLYADFDERELLRGSMADQASYFSAALGAGGHAPFMSQNEVRDNLGLSRHRDGDTLTNPMTAPQQPIPPPGGTPASTDGASNAA